MTVPTSAREGSLEAPTRHPLDWKNPDFWDKAALEKEMERTFDICHGCRRCVNLCTAFPTLFDLVDESKTMEVDGVDKQDFGKVVDQCYLCDMCYMTKTDFKTALGKVSYHIPCHSRVQNVGQKTRELLQLVPGTEVNTVERCAGHDGTWGVKTEYFDNSMKIDRPVFRQMASSEPDYISSDCPIAGRHIEQGMSGEENARPVEKAHPISLVRLAYAI